MITSNVLFLTNTLQVEQGVANSPVTERFESRDSHFFAGHAGTVISSFEVCTEIDE